MKLRHFEIDHYFQFGGFGDSHFDRDDVARLARDAAMKYLEDRFHPDRVWVIGDTPADVKCGRAIGAKVLAVGTGIHSMDHLESSKPDLLFESLADVDRVMASMLN
jgi:phosphoglycolate phosphatase